MHHTQLTLSHIIAMVQAKKDHLSSWSGLQKIMEYVNYNSYTLLTHVNTHTKKLQIT